MGTRKLEESPIRGAVGRFDQPSTMALALGGLYLAGAAIGAASLILPHPEEFQTGGLWSNVVIAFAGGIALVALHRLLPFWAVALSVLAGTAIITRAVLLGNDADGFYTFWYLWVGVYAFFFFGLRWGLVQIAAIGIAYGVALTELSEGTPVASWVVVVGSTLVAGLLVDMLAARLRSETSAAATRAANLEAVGEVARQLAIQSDPRAVGWAICSAAVKASGADAAVLWPASARSGARPRCRSSAPT